VTEEKPAVSQDDLPQAAIVEKRRLPSIVWLIPLVAFLIGVWLVYKTYSEKGPTITIAFETASGLEVGKTRIKYRDVDLGIVDSVDLSKDLSRVVVTAEMRKEIADQLREGTTFWIVEPRLTASGVSGLGTLVSGTYIAMRPGPGKAARKFTGLTEPPVLTVDVPGSRYKLHASKVGSISAGSGIYYRGIQVGQVLGYSLDDDGRGVTFTAFIAAPHDKLVRDRSRFWNASGVDMSLTSSGVTVRTESLQSVLTGGIAFDTAREFSHTEQSPEGKGFPLYESFSQAEEAGFHLRRPFLIYFNGQSLSGLDVGAPVLFYGIKVGQVSDVRIMIDPKTGLIKVPVTVEMEPQRLNFTGAFSMTEAEMESLHWKYMKEWVHKGLRAQLQSGNLLTGQQVIALKFFPKAAPAELDTSGKIPVIPSEPSEFKELSTQASNFLAKLESLPLQELINDLRHTIQSTDRLINSKSVKDAVTSLKEVGPLLDSLKATSDTARKALAKAETVMTDADRMVGEDSQLRYGLVQMIKELTDTSRTVRTLADTLQRHPEALIRGKEGSKK
jgi:paraquat-inducible protein B